MLVNSHTYLCSRKLLSHCATVDMPGCSPKLLVRKSSSRVSLPVVPYIMLIGLIWLRLCSLDKEKLLGFCTYASSVKFSADDDICIKLVVGGVKLFDLWDFGCTIAASKFNFSPSKLISTSLPFFENDSCNSFENDVSTESMPRNSTFLPMVRLNVLLLVLHMLSGGKPGSIRCCHTVSVFLLPQMWFSRYRSHCVSILQIKNQIT